MIYTHYSRTTGLTLKSLRDTTIEEVRDPRRLRFKPAGLWISHDEEYGWLDWCNREQFGTGTYRYELEIENNGLIWIANKKELMEFHDKYKTPLTHKMPDYCYIAWEEVFHEYNGIMIFPYIWEMRLDDYAPWYYPWDCASGCIWRPSQVVTSFKEAGNADEACALRGYSSPED